MTEKLFYKDSHLSKFDAEVLSCVRAKRQQVKDSFGRLDGKAGEYYEIELDRTAFFPEGGGQYADTGVLYMADDDTCGLDETARKKVQVLDVRERNGRIFHITDGFIEAKTAVKGSIDWEERFMKMQQHTGEHIVSGLIHAAYGYNNVGFHLGSEDCTMDFDVEITSPPVVNRSPFAAFLSCFFISPKSNAVTVMKITIVSVKSAYKLYGIVFIKS